MFSLLDDETKDTSKVEQMSINVSYVDNNTSLINERFLTFYHYSRKFDIIYSRKYVFSRIES